MCSCFLFRPSTCKFSRIGCPWRGPYHELKIHEETCTHPKKTGLEIMDSLYKIDDEQVEREKVYRDIFSLLSFEKITFNGKLHAHWKTSISILYRNLILHGMVTAPWRKIWVRKSPYTD